jgi:hypothetical protein
MRRLPASLLIAAYFVLTAGAAGSQASAPGQAAPVDTSLPTISGTTVQGQSLTASAGSWSGPNPSYSYQWQRCNSAGATCSAISGASSSAYAPQPSDVSSTLRVTVTATNKNGSTIATSNQTTVIVAAVQTTTSSTTNTASSSPTTTTASTSTSTSTSTGTTTTAPTGTTPPLFNGLATTMTCLWSVSPSNQGQCPTGMWDGLAFINNDIWLMPDSRYVEVYRHRVDDSSGNGYWDCGPTCSASELAKYRPTGINSTDWYTDAVRVDSPYTCTDWGLVEQFNYGLSSPPIGLALNCSQDSTDGQLHFGIDRNAGYISCVGCQDFTSWQHTQLDVGPFMNHWVEFVIGIHWAVDNTGWFEVYSRNRDNGETGFTLRLSNSNVPTMQQVKGQALPATTLDKQDHYFGYWSSADTPSPFPTNYVDHRGLERFSDKSSALASMG